jgi:hypothetical protein
MPFVFWCLMPFGGASDFYGLVISRQWRGITKLKKTPGARMPKNGLDRGCYF